MIRRSVVAVIFALSILFTGSTFSTYHVTLSELHAQGKTVQVKGSKPMGGRRPSLRG